jgi:hypothetical protein
MKREFCIRKRTLGRPRHRWEEDVDMDERIILEWIVETWREGVDWMHRLCIGTTGGPL